MDQNGPFWPEEVHFGPFRSANRTLAIPDYFHNVRAIHANCLKPVVRNFQARRSTIRKKGFSSGTS